MDTDEDDDDYEDDDYEDDGFIVRDPIDLECLYFWRKFNSLFFFFPFSSLDMFECELSLSLFFFFSLFLSLLSASPSVFFFTLFFKKICLPLFLLLRFGSFVFLESLNFLLSKPKFAFRTR